MRTLGVLGAAALAAVPAMWVGCGDDDFVREPPPASDGIYSYADACVTVEAYDGGKLAAFLTKTPDEAGFWFNDGEEAATRFTMRASDLGTYVFYDDQERYLTVAEEGSKYLLSRDAELETALSRLEDGFRSPAEWILEPSARDGARYQLKNYQTERYLSFTGLTEDPNKATIISLFPTEGCTPYPELGLDATGTAEARTFEDGDLWGVAEIHSHITSNFSFGAGSTFHGAPFHRLGVPYALPDCAQWHGDGGRKDIVGFFFDGDTSGLDVDALTPILISGQATEFNHETAGYPDFTDWPNGWARKTHQAMYYRWIERAYLGGLRLMVHHATGNSVLCELVTGIRSQTALIDCNDMVSVERQILEMRNMERYIDAQAGGPGMGWMRIVATPAEARQVIAEGKLAMVLGIEISNLFDCFATPRDGFPACTEQDVIGKLDYYRDQGVSVIFPVHKFDNGFSAGDGQDGIIELGNFVNSGRYNSFLEDCAGPDASFDGGDVTFGGLNQPRDDYDAPPDVDTSTFGSSPVSTLLPHLDKISEPGLEGNWCQSFGLTPLGETLMQEMMKRGMLIDIAHLPERGLARAYEILEAASYPALKTHGSTNGGRIYALGGMAGSGFDGCATPGETGSLGNRLRNAIAEINAAGGYPAEAFAFDFNGFATPPRPRFGPNSRCSEPQENPVTYPFASYDGAVTFEQAKLGNRDVDFNTEGMIHIGMLPELIQAARLDGVTDAELEPLFRSAEGYIRMWERAEERASSL